jgi:hypothetical protein
MPLRYDCEAFPGSFVEFSEAWTRGELRGVVSADVDSADSWRVAVTKITTCHIERIGEDDITDPAQLPGDLLDSAYDSVDMRLFRWLAHVALKAAMDVTNLGEEIAASLWRTTEAKAAESETTSS